jgi:hypothetical protein
MVDNVRSTVVACKRYTYEAGCDPPWAAEVVRRQRLARALRPRREIFYDPKASTHNKEDADMRKWIFTIAPLTLLVASTAIAHPIWARRADQTEVLNARITEVDRLGSQIVLEDQARITIPPSAQVAMTAVRPGETVDARFTEAGDEKTLLSLRVMAQDEQAP